MGAFRMSRRRCGFCVELDVVDQVVGRHDAADAAVLNDHLEVARVDLAQRLLVHFRVLRRARLLDVVGREVLGAGRDVLLQADREGRRHAADVVRVLAVGFLRAAPVGVADDVHAGGEQHVVQGRRRLVTGSRADTLLEVEIPGRRADRRSGEHRGVVATAVGAVVLPRVEVHAATGVAVVVPANVADARDVEVGAALDVQIVPGAGGDAEHLAGPAFAVHLAQSVGDGLGHLGRHAVGLHVVRIELLRGNGVAVELRQVPARARAAAHVAGPARAGPGAAARAGSRAAARAHDGAIVLLGLLERVQRIARVTAGSGQRHHQYRRCRSGRKG